MIKVTLIGDVLSKDLFPMRGIPQSIFRKFAVTQSEDIKFQYIKDEEVNSNHKYLTDTDVIIFMMSDGWNKNFYEILRDNRVNLNKKVLIGYSTELFEVWNRKSTYEYFNYYHQYAYRKGLEYKVFEKIHAVITPSLKSIKVDQKECGYEVPLIYYPFLYAPSVFEDKITYMEKLFDSEIKLSGNLKSKDISMVYKLGSPFRDKYSDELGKRCNITYGGKYKNNDNGVKGGYEFDIINDYYSKFKFNLAIENEFVKGYWTEKLINPLLADSVPIYYDPFNEFPSEIINQDSVIIFNDNNYEEKFNEVAQLVNDGYIERFRGVKIFADGAKIVFNNLLNTNFMMLANILNNVL